MLHGFQLWINLPAKDKMCKPWYQDYQAAAIPIVDKDGASVRVMAGESLGARGPLIMRNPGMLLDVRLSKGASFTQPVSVRTSGECGGNGGRGDGLITMEAWTPLWTCLLAMKPDAWCCRVMHDSCGLIMRYSCLRPCHA